MADSAHSTVTPDVHPLTGCSAPGAASPDFTSVAEMPSPFVSLGDAAGDVVAKLAARRAVDRLAAQHGPDAEVIELAERTEALALRERALWDWRADVDDAVTRALPSRPVRPTMQTRMQHAEATVDGARTFSITEPPEWRVEHRAVEAAHAAAVAEHERLEVEIGARLGLPLADKLASRASRRLSRWSRRLADLAPRTYAGLRAKAAVLRATAEDGQLNDKWRQVLAVSVSADAIRLIEAEAEERFQEDQARDGALFSLIAKHGPAMAELDAADEIADPVQQAWYAAKPAMPKALIQSLSDYPWDASGRESIKGSTSVFVVYLEHDIKKLRDIDPMKFATGPATDAEPAGLAWRPDPRRAARKAEILDAWDRWQAEIEASKDSSGLNAANAAVTKAAVRVDDIEDAIIDYPPRTFEGLQAKARWIASTSRPARLAQNVLRDLCRMPPIAMAPPAQVTPSREVVETYRAFLDLEFRFLNWETHGTAHASGGIWLDNPAGSLHGGDGPPPSSRAIAVLIALGLMPNTSAEDKRDAEARAA